MRIVAAVIAALLLMTPAAAQVVSPAEMLRSSVSNFIRPQTKAFALRTAELSKAMYVLCETGDLRGAQEAFASAASAYGRIEFLRVGPLMEANRAERILFFPDRKGIGLRQIQQLLAEKDLAATTVPGLQGKSVALQGLGALEFVLFGAGFETIATSDGAFRCAYGAAIAKNLEQMASEIAASWADPEGIAKRLAQPDAAYADYRTSTESLEAVVGLVSHGIENMCDTRINPVIANIDREANPKQALFWRSGLTMAMLDANVEGLRALVELSSVATDPALLAEITSAFDRAETAIAAVTLPIDQALADPEQAGALVDLVGATQDLQRLIGEDLSATLGLSVGFSSLDGD